LWVEAPCSATNEDGKTADGEKSTESGNNNKLVDTVIYASSGVINLATSHKTTSNNCITSVAKTLITRTLDHSSAPLQLLGGHNDAGNATAAAASTKKVLARGEAVEDAAASRSVTALAWFVSNDTAATIVDVGANSSSRQEAQTSSSSPSSTNHLVVLISEGNFNYTQAANQTNALLLLNDLAISYTTIDGMDPNQYEKRNQLFDLSGIRGNYPQFFLCRGEEYEFLGSFEWLESCNLDELQKRISVTEGSTRDEVVKTDDDDDINGEGNSGSDATFGIVSAFSDGTVTLWKWKQNDHNWLEHVLIGHDPDPDTRAKHHVDQDGLDADNLQESIADISAVSLGSNTALVATASSKGIIIHLSNLTTQQDVVYSRQISHHPSASVHFVETSKNECYLFSGTASPRHNKVWVYTIPYFSPKVNSAWVTLPVLTIGDPICHGSLLGHQDWITCFAWLDNLNVESNGEDREEALLASSGHDAKIRLWKFATRASSSNEAIEVKDEVMADEIGNDDDDDLTSIEGEDEVDEAIIDDLEEEEGEARLMIYHSGSSTAVSLEALLLGHEEPVTSLSWRKRKNVNEKPCLLSSSMDRTILLWMDDEDVWAPVSRVGSAGGILGGSIGASLMGFVDARFSPSCNRIVGHGYGGSIHLWTQEELPQPEALETDEVKQEEEEEDELLNARWVADPCITGHFRSVEDMAWDPQGEYLLTTSTDQTTRLWAEVMVGSSECRWVEVGRPQVHGYDMTSIACVGGTDATTDDGVPRHRFISGADEKVLRVFDAPVSTLRLLRSLKQSRLPYSSGNTSAPNEDSASWRVERAFLPSLGLSNKATADQEQESSNYSGPTNDDEFAESLDTLEREHVDFTLPSERDLGVTTLWPETRKLFGHESELVCLDAYRALMGSDEPSLVASSCKARNDVASAAIRLWDAKEGKCVGILKGGHRSTVSTMSFSRDGKYLASSGKDRRICIWKKLQGNLPSSDEDAGGYELAAAADSAHKRIVWSVHFCPSMPTILASGSRDGFVRVWKVCETEGGDAPPQLKELLKFEPSTKGGKKSEPVTAVAFAEGLPDDDIQYGILGLGTESGRIEIWAVPVSDSSAEEPTLLHAIAANDSHFDTVKKLAWRPLAANNNVESGSTLEFTLASCSQDTSVRIYSISVST
jgi:elongator complex protein 2